MNLDNQTINFLSKDVNKYLTWEANGKKGVGICGDISGCNPKGTSILLNAMHVNGLFQKLIIIMITKGT